MVVKKFYSMTFIKVMMMLFVVLHHSTLFFGGNWFTIVQVNYCNNFLYFLSLWLNTFQLHAFVMVSGFLFYYSKSERNYYSHLKFIAKKVKRLLLPYIFVGLFWVIPIKCFIEGASFIYQLKLWGLGIAAEQLWFLMMLFVVFIIFEFFYNKIMISKRNLLFMMLLFPFLSYIFSYYHINYFQIHNVCKYIPFFYLGGYLYHNINNKFNLNNIYIPIIIICVLLIISSFFNTYVAIIIRNVLLQFVSMIEVIIVYLSSNYIIQRKKDIINEKMFLFLEKYSFGIYLFHLQIVFILITILNGRVYPLIQAILSFIISIIVSIIISFVLSRNKIMKKVIGM